MRPDRLAAVAILGLTATFAASETCATDLALRPGRYHVEVRVSLPNVGTAAPPLTASRCITPDDLRSGGAFFILSDNPLKRCPLIDYQTSARSATYRIVCEGPNRGSASALFDLQENAYRGTIQMNMGGKNMTMAETQVGKRIGDCP